MIKINLKIIGAIVLVGSLLVGCAGTTIKHLSANEFIEQAKQIEQMNSASWTTYIGSTRDRAYLEYSDALTVGQRTKTIVYWTELDKLPTEIVEVLKQGKSPWIPWLEQNKKAKDNHQIKRIEWGWVLPEKQNQIAVVA